MIAVRLTKSFTVTGNDDLDAHTDAVMDELLALEGEDVTDADVSANLEDRTVEISIVAHADDFDTALSCADGVIRTAIHATGAHTPEWDAAAFTPSSALAGLVDA
jgi:hypothetical protein